MPLVAIEVACAEEAPVFILAWGTFGSGNGQFSAPVGVAVDGLGGVYVADMGNDRVQKFSGTGAFSLAWGHEGTGDGEFEGPGGIAVEVPSTVLVVDRTRVQKFDLGGGFLGQFAPMPTAPIDVDPVRQYVYLVGQKYVWQYTSDGILVRQWMTLDRSDASNQGVAVGPSGNVYVTEGGAGDGVWKFSPEGVFLGAWGGFGSEDGKLKQPYGIAVDADENVYVCDTGNGRIQKFTPEGVFLAKWGTPGSGNGQFTFPADVAVDGDGNIYVTDSNQHRVQKFGSPPTPATPTTWGRIKALYRDRAASPVDP